MPIVRDVFFRPPLAVARLGASATPLDNFEWRDDPTIHGAARTVIEPAITLEVAPDGSTVPYRPSLIRFRDGGALRPVAPFFELWARIEYTADDPEVADDGMQAAAGAGDPAAGAPNPDVASSKAGAALRSPASRRSTTGGAAKAPNPPVAAPPPGGGPRRRPGDQDVVALTSSLLERAGGSIAGVLYTVHLANRKAARRSGDPANSFEANLQVVGDDHRRHQLLAFTAPRPNQEPLVLPDRPIPLGWFQVLQPVPRTHVDVDLDVLRMRFTPARGEVYGPGSAVEGADESTGRPFQLVPAENRILNQRASWLRYDGSYSNFLNPEPWDTYDGADQNDNVSWGVVDDTCDGLIRAEVVIRGRRHLAAARVTVGPPDYAPDRRPFLSLADDLADRDEEPVSLAEIQATLGMTLTEVTDLFQRVFETAGLINLDAIRSRGLDDDQALLSDPGTRVGKLPFTDATSMTGADKPYASAKVEALTPQAPVDPGATPLPYSQLVPLAHERLAQQDELLDFLTSQPDRVRLLLRPPYGQFAELKAKVQSGDGPNPDFRDPRLARDQAHDMRMPPYMRDELGAALSLTRRQYLAVLRYVEALAARPGARPAQPALAALKKPLRVQVAAAVAEKPEEPWWKVQREVLQQAPARAAPDPDSPLRQRVNSVLERIRQRDRPTPGGSKP
jgi:hypothetical protein